MQSPQGGFGLQGCMAVSVTVPLQTGSSASRGQPVQQGTANNRDNPVYNTCHSHTWLIIQLVLRRQGEEVPETEGKDTSILHEGGWEAVGKIFLLILLQGTSEKWQQWCNLQTREQNCAWVGKLQSWCWRSLTWKTGRAVEALQPMQRSHLHSKHREDVSGAPQTHNSPSKCSRR